MVGHPGMRNEPDGRVSAATIFQKAGLIPFAIVVLSDISISTLAVFTAKILTGSTAVSMIAGIAAVAGHNWSIFIKFKGGLGATSILGVLVMITSWAVIIGLVASGVTFGLTRRPGLSTACGIMAISGYLYIQYSPGTPAIYPWILLCLMLVKRFQAYRLPGLQNRI
jgi:glycerol-3-phosphate acyltransferase PlsY